ncbi:major capsid protein [Cereibacter sphaeroides f. sp. denitrificans]
MDTVLFQHTDPVSRSIDYTHENLRFGAVKGVQYAADGSTVLFDFYNAAGVTKPSDVELDFGVDRKTLMNGYADVTDYVRTGLQVDADIATGIVAVYGKTAWRNFRTADAVAALYELYLQGAVNRVGATGQRVPFELFDVTHVPYFGASIGDDEIRFLPVGVPGLFRTDYTPLDNQEAANTLGLPLYATPEVLAYGKGYGIELASLPIHYVTRPECLIGGKDVTGV